MMNTFTLPDGRRIECLDLLTARYCANEIFGKGDYAAGGFIQLKAGDTVVDVGANIGLFSLWAMPQIDGGRLLALEPVPVIHGVLSRNLEAYGAGVTWSAPMLGASDQARETRIRYYPKVSADSALARPDGERKVRAIVANWDRRMGDTYPALRAVPRPLRAPLIRAIRAWQYRGRPVPCRLDTLSAIVEREGIGPIDLIKIDAENHDRQVLAGISDELWARVRQVAMEVHEHVDGWDGLGAEIGADLERRGFEVRVEDEYEPGIGVRMVFARRRG
jgi:phthiocerol/phenolphthiocerol synthesis type-I polyketide synthase E